MKAISIRQPWAWLITHGYKNIENRSWKTKYRGTVLIHASSRLTLSEYENLLMEVRRCSCEAMWALPTFEEMRRQCGGIVGFATITGCCESSGSPWFFGPVGWQLSGGHPLPFEAWRGRLSFFDTPFDLAAAGHTYALITNEILPASKGG